jgi:glycerol-3-phosphate dehydrogenase subunit C
LNSKIDYVNRHGLAFGLRVLEKVEGIGEVGGAFPRLGNYLLQNRTVRTWLDMAAGIHRERRIPLFPKKRFTTWLRARPAEHRSSQNIKGKVVYFAGCTARYFFPEVAAAAVQVLERNGLEVMFPEEHCCGMPALLEGDLQQAGAYAKKNMAPLAEAVEAGYDIVCSCPTCGYMLKKIWRLGAGRALWREELEKNDTTFTTVHKGHGLIGELSENYSLRIRSSLLKRILQDEGAFSSLDPRRRLRISENTYDLGEYLLTMHRRGLLDTALNPVRIKAAYYPPCHLREQGSGLPYQTLLRLIPGLALETLSGDTCCGSGGLMGLKKEFHPWSIRIGSRLMLRTRNLNPDIVATDCLSCRMQFHQLTPFEVVHPIQIMQEAYTLPRTPSNGQLIQRTEPGSV